VVFFRSGGDGGQGGEVPRATLTLASAVPVTASIRAVGLRLLMRRAYFSHGSGLRYTAPWECVQTPSE